MAVDMFLKIETVKGESLDKTHKGSIDILAWSWGMSNSSNAHAGGGAGAGKVNVQDLSVTKFIDASSTALALACANGTHFTKAVLTVRKAGKTPLEYLKITMDEKVFVNAYTTGGSGGEDRLTENIVLNFAKVKVEYTKQKSDGSADGGAMVFGWDIAANVKTG